jgi:hypothetical protein
MSAHAMSTESRQMEKVFALVHEISEENNKELRGKIDALKKENHKIKSENHKLKGSNKQLNDQRQRCVKECARHTAKIRILAWQTDNWAPDLAEDHLAEDWEFEGVAYLLNTENNKVFDENLVRMGTKTEDGKIEWASDEARDAHEEYRDDYDVESDTDDEDVEE